MTVFVATSNDPNAAGAAGVLYNLSTSDSVDTLIVSAAVTLVTTGTADFAAVLAAAVEVTGGVRITYAAGDTLFLVGVTRASLNAPEFVFG